jgi:hypothetical protein
MDRHEKAQRALVLSETIRKCERELDQLFGDTEAPQKRTWSRRPKAEQPQAEQTEQGAA